MGVEYFPCAHCKTIICDAGDYDICGGCGAKFCLCCKSQGYSYLGTRGGDDDDDDSSDEDNLLLFSDECAGHQCILCTDDYARKKITDAELVQFLLKTSPYQTRTEAEAALRAQAD